MVVEVFSWPVNVVLLNFLVLTWTSLSHHSCATLMLQPHGSEAYWSYTESFSPCWVFRRWVIVSSSCHREYILRAAVLLVTGALTINPVSLFSGNIACFGLKQGCSAETGLMCSFGPFFKLQFNEVKLTRHFSEKLGTTF